MERKLAQVSVVVPTRDRPVSLRRCLEALRAQRPPVEIVVVDDGSRDPDAVRSATAGVGATLVRAGGAGPAAARNAGADGAGGSVVCFTDDDCEPDPDWASELATAVEAAGGVAAGRTLNARDGSAVAAASQTVASGLMLHSLDPESGRLGFAPSCNLAIAVRHLPRLRFDPGFTGAAGEDREWSARASRLGLAPAYAPAAVVRHHQRLRLRDFARQQIGYGRGALRYRRAVRPSERPVRRRGLRTGLVLAGLREGGPPAGALVLLAQPLTAFGMLLEALRARRR